MTGKPDLKEKGLFIIYSSKNLRGLFLTIFCPSPVASKIFFLAKNILLNLFLRHLKVINFQIFRNEVIIFPRFTRDVISRVSEPEPGASYKSRRLRNPETPCRYIIARVNESIYFFITLGTLLKSLFTNLLNFDLWEPGAVGSKTLVISSHLRMWKCHCR